MIELKNVTKYYPVHEGVRYILRDVSLVIPSGTNLAVLGSNGAGKSTLLRLIGGSEAPNSGTIFSDQTISWPLGLGTGFQSALTGRQNVMFVCRINGLDTAQKKQVLEEVTEFAELGEYFDLPVKTYSSGMRARLSFGLSMAFLFDYYLVDELTSVGDAVFRQKAMKAFQALRRHASLIFVSHNLQTLRESCDSALFLNNGSASFFPDIEDGIAAYESFISTDRLSHARELHAIKKARRAEKLKRKLLRAEQLSNKAGQPGSDPQS
jgi:capsular polysaccharide transport system ATP-binding protein